MIVNETPQLGMNEKFFLVVDTAKTGQQIAGLTIFARPSGAGADFVADLVGRLRHVRTFAAPFNYVLVKPKRRRIAPAVRIAADTEIDMSHHVRHHVLPAPGTHAQLDELISELHAPTLDFTRPLWEFHVVDGLEGGRFATFAKFHHAVFDGIGYINRFLHTVTATPEPDTLQPVWAVGATGAAPAALPKPDKAELAAVKAYFKQHAKAGPTEYAAPFAAPKTMLAGRLTRNRRIDTTAWSLDRVRAIAAAGQVTVNDVLVSSVAGGLRRYLAERGRLPGTSLITSVPFSIRTAADDASANAFSTILITMFTDIADPVQRLAAVGGSSRIAKADIRGRAPEVAAMYSPIIGGSFMLNQLTGLAGRIKPPFSLITSCIPGPDGPRWFAGAPLESMLPIGPIYHGCGLMVTALTMSGAFGVGLTSCPDVVPHARLILDYSTAALGELEAALLVGATN